jgi:hypothetical protein
MKQENKFVAQLFHFLAPFVDTDRELYICVDGGAANHHAGRDGSALLDPDVPDLWLAFQGQQSHTGIEAKILEGNSISVRQSQLRAWRSSGKGVYKPKYWVASNRTLSEYYCWDHSIMLPRLDATKSTVDNVAISMAKTPSSFSTKSLASLALYVLSRHRPST